MSKKELREKTAKIIIKHHMDTVFLPPKTAIRLGIEYVTLKGAKDIKGINFDEKYVSIKNEDLDEICKAVRRELNEIHLHELTEDEVEKLQNQIVFGSLYVADYENTFGVNPNEVCSYADGYLETKGNPEEYGEYEAFYDYIQSVEWID